MGGTQLGQPQQQMPGGGQLTGYGGQGQYVDPFSSVFNWDPFTSLGMPFGAGFGSELGFPRGFGDMMSRMPQGAGLLKLDIKENDHEFQLSADVPGVSKVSDFANGTRAVLTSGGAADVGPQSVSKVHGDTRHAARCRTK